GAGPDGPVGRRGRAQRLEAARPPAKEGHQAAGGVRRVKLVVLTVLAGVALVCATPAQAARPKGKTIRIYDNYFVPDAVKVKRGATVTWKWPGFEEAGDVHDVKLQSGPKGVKKFHSEAASTAYRFKRKRKVAGTYKLVCTLHHEMRMTIKVRK